MVDDTLSCTASQSSESCRDVPLTKVCRERLRERGHRAAAAVAAAELHHSSPKHVAAACSVVSYSGQALTRGEPEERRPSHDLEAFRGGAVESKQLLPPGRPRQPPLPSGGAPEREEVDKCTDMQGDCQPEDAVADHFFSQGGLLHETGACRPCRYFGTTRGCLAASCCRFCHFLHSDVRQRPSKTTRSKIKKLVTGLDLNSPQTMQTVAAMAERKPYLMNVLKARQLNERRQLVGGDIVVDGVTGASSSNYYSSLPAPSARSASFVVEPPVFEFSTFSL